jgi:alcohol dehydrogenase class IV
LWYFFSPNIIYGEDSLEFLGKIKGEKCFIVTDKVIEEMGYLKILTDRIEKYGRKYTVFNDVVPDPHEDDIMKGKKQCISYAPDLIIALGGGSVMDSAKAIWAMYENPEFSVDNIDPFNEDLYNIGNKAKLIAIPTTSGTGADVSWVIIITRFQNNIWRKASTGHKSLIPTYAIVDPIFPMGMPPKLTVYTAFDSLAHAMEGYISSWRNEFSNALGIKAIELIFKYLPVVYNDGNNKEARDYMHQAASMAGLAFSNGQAHIGHAIGHSWSGVFHTPHGQSVGLFLRYVTQYCLNDPGETNDSIQMYSDLAKKLGWAKWDDENKKAAYTVVDKIKELQNEVDFATKLKDLGIQRDEFEKNLNNVISLCYQDPSSVMAPRTPNMEEFAKILTYAYEGRDIDF